VGYPCTPSKTWTSTAFTRRSTSPRSLPGFAGQRLQQVTTDRDPGAGLGPRLERLASRGVGGGPSPTESFPASLPWLLDPELGANMIRGERRARVFTPSRSARARPCSDLPSIHSGHWDPMMAAVRRDRHRGEPAHRLFRLVAVHHRGRAAGCGRGVLFFAYAISAAVDWLYSGLPSRFPESQNLSVGGRNRLGSPVCWIASTTCSAITRCMALGQALGESLTPAEVFHAELLVLCGGRTSRRSCSADRIGVENIMLEADYPHCDSTWPAYPADDPRKKSATLPHGRDS